MNPEPTSKRLNASVSAGFGLLVSVLFCLDSPATADEPFSAFFKRCGRKAAAAETAGTMTVQGRDGWLFLGAELRCVSVGDFWGDHAQATSRAARPDRRDPLPAIVDFKNGLARAGIELLVVPVPPKVLVYPEKFGPNLPNTIPRNPQAPALNGAFTRFYGVLRKNGVQVLDLYPLFWKERHTAGGAVYCARDTHWSGRGCVLAARAIAQWVSTKPWYSKVDADRWKRVKGEVRSPGDLRRALPASTLSDETLPVWFVTGRNGQPPVPDRKAPILLLGDSHTLVFHSGGDMIARGAGLVDQLAFELGFPVDLLGVRGSGAGAARISLFRRARADAAYLKSKKLVVWCFAARDFTEAASGWRKVPVPR